MKKIVTLFAAVLCAAVVFGQSYGILVNGNTYFAGEPAGTNEGFTQYVSHVQVNAGDYCQLYDASNEASWVVPLNTWSVQGFTLNNDRYEVTVSGCYDFYIKLKYGADELYIGNGSNCGSGTPIGGGDTQDTTATPVVTVSSVPSEAPDVMLQAFYWDSYPGGSGNAYGNTGWSTLLSQADEIGSYFDLVWFPPASFSTGGTGYIPRQYNNLNSDWGSEANLRSLISVLHNANTRVVADIVINHCGNNSSSCNFYPMDFTPYGTFQPDNTWITTDDEGNCGGGSHADVGYNGEANYESARDWDHQNSNVQAMCRAYLQWMKAQGFDGWRYDYGKGFTHDHIDDYNKAAGAYLSVVEYWDGNRDVLQARLNEANWNTMVFDFSTKYNALNDGICAYNYSKCQGAGLPGAGKSKYAVTFVDNHDTFTRNSSEFGGQNNSMTAAMKDRLLQANAFILSMPGIPCVFYPHWVTYKAELKKMIEARHLTGVHSESAVYDEQVETGGYQATIAGKNGYIVLQLGNKAGNTISGFTKYAYGNGYAIWIHTNDGVEPEPQQPEVNYTYYIKNNWNGGADWTWQSMTLAADSLTCTFTGVFGGTGVNINSEESDEGAVWYPVANMVLADGAPMPQENDTVLFTYTIASGQLAAQVNGRPAAEPEPEVEMITYYAVNTPRWSVPYAYVWKGQSDAYKPWPGETMTRTDENFRGYEVYSYTMPKEYTNMIVNNGKGGNENQTPDMQLDTTKRYMYELQWYASLDAVPAESQDTTVTPDPVGQPHFYLTGNDAFVGAGKTAWNKDDAYVSYSDTLTLNLGAGTYEVKLINANDEWKGYDALSQPITAGITTNSWGNICFQLAQAGQVTFIYKTDNTFRIEGTFVTPEYHFYYVGTNNGWDPATAIEFTNNDSAYTLAMDSLYGTFKIMTVRNDWTALSYGANSQGAQVSAGVPYEMAEWGGDMLVNGVFADVTLAITLEAGVATITILAEEDTTSVTPGPQDTTVVAMITYYAVNSPRWPMPYAYVWKGESDAYKPWPGETMTRTDENFRGYEVYSYTMPKEFTKMVINNGKGGNDNQTPDMVLDTTLRYMYNLQWYASLEAIPADQQDTTGGGEQPQDTTIVPPVVDEVTVYTVMPEGWSALNAYVWSPSLGYLNWPGEAMANTGETFRGDSVYSYTFPAYCTKIIFHNGNGQQTPDLNLDPTKPYYYAETWFSSWDAVPEEVIVIPATYYITGNASLVVDAGVSADEAWVANAIKATSDTTILNLHAGTEYHMALTLSGVWGGENNVKAFADLTVETPGVVADRTGYIAFTPAVDGPVMIICNDTLFTIQGTFVIPEPVVNMTIYTVLPEGWTDMFAYVWDDVDGSLVQWPGEYMTKTNETFRDDTVYSYTFPNIYTKIIFHNGAGTQTPDILLDTTKLYYYGDTWYASWEAVPEEVIVLPAKYYATGNVNLVVAAGLSADYAWDAAAIKVTSDTLLLNLHANTEYELALNLNGTWARNVIYFSNLTEVTPGLTATGDGYIGFTMAEDGLVTVIYNDSVFTVEGKFVVPAKETYYIKNNWNGGEWTWQQMYVLGTDSLLWGYTGVFGGVGVNISTAGDNTEPDTWYAISDFIVYEGELIPQALDTVYFVYDAMQHTVTAMVEGRPGSVEPQPQPVAAYYLVGEFNGWNTQTAIPFTNADSVYTVTIDTLRGAYKVLTERSWQALNYGAYQTNEELIMGVAYMLLEGGHNLYSTTIYLNATLHLREVGEDVSLTLVSGTPYEAPQEERHFYLVGEFNGWNVAEAPEFAFADSMYTITIDTIAGEFKVTGARDWNHGNYGGYNTGDMLNLGGEYNMTSQNSQNLTFSQTYTNVTLTLTVANDVVTIHFVAGTPVQGPATALDALLMEGHNTVKFIENGRMYIMRNGVKYNAEGQVVR